MGANLSEFVLISGADIHLDCGVTLRQPKLSDIRELGYDTYRTYLSQFLMTRDTLLELLKVDPEQVPAELTLYLMLGSLHDIREMLVPAFSFFVVGQCTWPDEFLRVDGRPLDNAGYEEICESILQLSYIASAKPKETKFASAAAKRIHERLQKGRESLQRAKKDANTEIPNLIGAVAAMHGGYTLFNIWDLTVYQLYDQFARVNTKVQLSVYGQRWAAWGEKDFDTTMWFQSNMRKDEN